MAFLSTITDAVIVVVIVVVVIVVVNVRNCQYALNKMVIGSLRARISMNNI